MIKKKSLKIFCLVLVITFLTVVSGCGIVDKMKEKFNAEEEPEILIETGALEEENAVEDSSLDLEPIEPTIESAEESIAVELWFAGAEGDTLAKEVREISKVEGIARETISELIKGPSPESNLLPTVPVGTELLDINVKDDGLIIVDFSKELIENHIGTPQAEALTVYSIVNTLCQFPTVDRVQFLVEGKYVDTLAGSINVSTALSPNTEL